MIQMINKGFSLIELMITISVISILAAVVIPAYNDYQCTEHNQCENVSPERKAILDKQKLEKITDKTQKILDDALSSIHNSTAEPSDSYKLLQQRVNDMQAKTIELEKQVKSYQTTEQVSGSRSTDDSDVLTVSVPSEYLFNRNDSVVYRLKRHNDGKLYACSGTECFLLSVK